MNDRFSKLFSIPSNLYTENSPLLITAGVLLKDNSTQKILVQLKLKNLIEKNIIALNVSINGYSLTNELTDNITNYQMLDFNAGYRVEFGQKSPIFLANNNTRSYTIRINEVVFADKTTWICDDDAEWLPIPEQLKLSEYFKDQEISEQYKRETNKSAVFRPTEYKDLWLCCCGSINKNDKTHTGCSSCVTQKDKIFKCLDIETLKNNNASYKLELSKQQEKEKAETTKKKRKIILLSSISVIIIIMLIITFSISNSIQANKYEHAINLLEQENYAEAISVFSDLNHYKDSYEMKYAISYYQNNEICDCIQSLMNTYNYNASRVLLAKIARVDSNDILYTAYVPWRNAEWNGEYRIIYSTSNGTTFYSILDY